jgi:hypothetical protein
MVRVNVSGQGHDLQTMMDVVKKHGMKVDAVHDAIGVISGEISEERLTQLAKAPGLSVERDQPVQLPPPDADVQ